MPRIWTGATTLEKKGEPALWEKFGGSVARLERYVNKRDVNWSAFNPSICGTLVAVRSSNYVILEHGELHVSTGGPIRNRVYVADIERVKAPARSREPDTWSLRNYRRVSFEDVSRETGLQITRGIEDAKLFTRDGNWMMTGVMLERGHTPVARQVTCELEVTAKSARAVSLVKHPGALSVKPEKNWMLPMTKPSHAFDFVYGANAWIRENELITALGHDEDWALGLRGNTHLLELTAEEAGGKGRSGGRGGGGYLCVMHRLLTKRGTTWDSRRFGNVEFCHKDYHHFLVRLDESGIITAISEPFQFAGAGIEFAAGIERWGTDIVVTLGRGDIEAWVAWAPMKNVLRAMKAIES